MNDRRDEARLAQLLISTRPKLGPEARERVLAAIESATRGARVRFLTVTASAAIAATAVLLVGIPGLRQMLGPRRPLLAVVAVRGPVRDRSGHTIAVGDRLASGATV